MRSIYIILFLFACNSLCAQVKLVSKTDPAARVKESLQDMGVAIQTDHPVKLIQKKLSLQVKNFENVMNDVKRQCPYLKFRPDLSLEVERFNDQKVNLKWETINGFDNLSFDVTRSLGDTFHFENVNFVWADARIRIKNKYQLPDENDFNETSYYRLRLQLTDGSYVYSNIAAVKGYNNILFTVFPNPVINKLTMNISSKRSGTAMVSIIDATGRTVQQRTENIRDGNNQQEINVASLVPGLYTVRWILPGNEVRTGKFIKN